MKRKIAKSKIDMIISYHSEGLSINQIYKKMKEKGIAISINTVNNYVRIWKKWTNTKLYKTLLSLTNRTEKKVSNASKGALEVIKYLLLYNELPS